MNRLNGYRALGIVLSFTLSTYLWVRIGYWLALAYYVLVSILWLELVVLKVRAVEDAKKLTGEKK